jgi:uncharacterized metal-binding protein YceD (DUF177 family)
MQADDEPAWSYEVELASVGREGQSFELVPDEATRARLAEAAGVVSVPSLTVHLEVRPTLADGAEVTGKLEGVVRQTCVVSLEDFDNPVAENIAVDFAAEPESKATTDDEEEIEDLPDPIVDGKIDLGALAAEFLILAVDPYPRKPGAAFAGPVLEEAPPEPKRSPFEQLSGLKERIKKQ